MSVGMSRNVSIPGRCQRAYYKTYCLRLPSVPVVLHWLSERQGWVGPISDVLPGVRFAGVIHGIFESTGIIGVCEVIRHYIP